MAFATVSSVVTSPYIPQNEISNLTSNAGYTMLQFDRNDELRFSCMTT
jgi:hypothetical protein